MTSGVPKIKQRTAQPDLSLFPNLLYLGPQRTGSTWLHANLSRHPEVHLHRDKETFYFSTLGRPDAPRYRFDYLEDYLESFREGVGTCLLKNYHALRRCGSFYRPRVRGDFTASYGVLEEDVIDEIVRLRPDVRGIILVRDPVERAWSHAKKDLVRGRDRAADDAEILAFIRSPDQLARADYRAAIVRWRPHLAPGSLFVAPYSRIATDPEALLDEISAFLGIRRLGGASKRHVTTRQNVTPETAAPEALQAAAETALAPATASCRELLREIGAGRIY
jgi:hypothetical protein